ncbi:hypothetical protein F4775DRAFT_606635 [Biscogniauxia sp. FL1348]|nr:hypothetical protein F4775DRAFT_606635 [Biscogniauxia sp. FL1348]
MDPDGISGPTTPSDPIGRSGGFGVPVGQASGRDTTHTTRPDACSLQGQRLDGYDLRTIAEATPQPKRWAPPSHVRHRSEVDVSVTLMGVALVRLPWLTEPANSIDHVTFYMLPARRAFFVVVVVVVSLAVVAAAAGSRGMDFRPPEALRAWSLARRRSLARRPVGLDGYNTAPVLVHGSSPSQGATAQRRKPSP